MNVSVRGRTRPLPAGAPQPVCGPEVDPAFTVPGDVAYLATIRPFTLTWPIRRTWHQFVSDANESIAPFGYQTWLVWDSKTGSRRVAEQETTNVELLLSHGNMTASPDAVVTVQWDTDRLTVTSDPTGGPEEHVHAVLVPGQVVQAATVTWKQPDDYPRAIHALMDASAATRAAVAAYVQGQHRRGRPVRGTLLTAIADLEAIAAEPTAVQRTLVARAGSWDHPPGDLRRR